MFIYIHASGLIHRDLKAANILVNKKWDVKITAIKNANRTMTVCGTVAWMAPEILQKGHFSEMSDVYAFGMVMYEVMTRHSPFNGVPVMSLVPRILSGQRPAIPDNTKGYSAAFVSLMQSTWSSLPEERPTFRAGEDTQGISCPFLVSPVLRLFGIRGMAPFTLSLWVKPDLPVSFADGMGSWMAVLGECINLNLRPGTMLWKVQTTGSISVGAYRTSYSVSGVPGIAGEWMHVATTYDGAAGGAAASTYLNGELVDISVIQVKFQNWPQLFLGLGLISGLCYSGAMDDVRLYGRALSSQEVYGLWRGLCLGSGWSDDDSNTSTAWFTDDDSDPATPCVSVCSLIATPELCNASADGCGWCYTQCAPLSPLCNPGCPAGTTGIGFNATTPCAPCGPGTYVPSGSVGDCSAFVCPAGFTDNDSDAATPCTRCGTGSYVGPNTAGVCTPCPAGLTDDDRNSSTECVRCGAGAFVPQGSSGPCALLGCGWGVWDNDSDPATPCVSVCTLIGVPVECFDSVYGCDWCGVSCTHKGGCGIAAKNPPTTSGLVLHWTFEGSTESERLADVSGHHMDGVLRNSSRVLWTTGVFGTAMRLAPVYTIDRFTMETRQGGEYDGYFQCYFGLVDDIRIYSRRLSDEEIYGVYHVGSSGPCANFTCAPGFVDHDSDPSTPCTSLCFRITSAGECNKSLLGCEWCGRYCATRSHCDCSQVLDQETCLASVNCTWCSGQSQCFPGACPVAGGARSKAAVIGGAVGGGGGAAVVLVVVGGLALGRWIRKRQKLTYHDEVDASEILMGEVIGQGSFGVVYKALWRDTEVAAKVFSVESLAAGSIAQFEKEVDVMRALRHPNILLFMCHAKNDTSLIILMPSGNLMELLANETAIVYLRLKLSILSDIARGMAYLHQTDPPILHRDLKSSNILLDSNMQAKVSDFGLTMFSHKGAGSRDSSAVVGTIFWTAPELMGDSYIHASGLIHRDLKASNILVNKKWDVKITAIKNANRTMTVCGTVAWMAPEILQKGHFSEMSDVYAFGMVMYEVMTRHSPFNGVPVMSLVPRILSGQRPAIPDNTKGYSAAFVSLMQSTWSSLPEERATFVRISAGLADMTS
eukprot:m51a1_g14 putative pas domain-containing protein tyrosine kinase (1101) ;mRNA; f:72168-80630